MLSPARSRRSLLEVPSAAGGLDRPGFAVAQALFASRARGSCTRFTSRSPYLTRAHKTTWDLNGTRQIVPLYRGGTCTQQGADQVIRTVRRELQARHLDPLAHTARTRCMGRCDDACTVVIMPDNVWYRNVTPALAQRIVAEHLVGGVPVRDQVSFLSGADGVTQMSGAQPGMSNRE